MNARRTTIVLLVLAVVAAIAFELPLLSWITALAAWSQGHRGAAAVLFLLVYVLAAVLLVPGSILTLAAGYLFGLPLGVALTSLGSMLGAAAAFLVGRSFAHDWVAHRVAASPKFSALAAALHHDGFAIVLLARLSPLIPYNLLNYVLSITGARFRDYALASWLGMLPAIVLYVYTGSLAKSLTMLTSADGAPAWATHGLLAVGFLSTIALTVLITRRSTRILRDRLAAESQQALPDNAQ